MENFIYSINVTLPIFLVMVLGWFLKQRGMLDEHLSVLQTSSIFRLPCRFWYSVIWLQSIYGQSLMAGMYCSAHWQRQCVFSRYGAVQSCF